MLAIKVELHPFGDARKAKNIGNMVIYNKGGTRERGEYGVIVLKEGISIPEGRAALLERTEHICDISGILDAETEVTNYPRLDEPVWELITQALENAGFGHLTKSSKEVSQK